MLWFLLFSTPLHNGSLSCMSKGFHHLGIALNIDYAVNLSKLITKQELSKLQNLGKIKILISSIKVGL